MADPLTDILVQRMPAGGAPDLAQSLVEGAASPPRTYAGLSREQYIAQYGVDPEAGFLDRTGQALQEFGKEAAPTALLAALGPIGKGVSSVVNAAPKVATPLLAALGLGASAAGAGDAGGPVDAAQSVAPTQENLTRLLQQQSALMRQTEDARNRREIERKSGIGPRFQAADGEFRQLNDQLTTLNKIIETAQRRGSPEFALEMRQKEAEAAEAARLKRAATPTRELLSDYTGYIPAATGALALALGAGLKGRATKNFNTEISDISNRMGQAVSRAQAAPGASAGYKAARAEAQGLGKEYDDLVASQAPRVMGMPMPNPGTRHALEGGVAAGVLGAFAPEEVDFARAVAGSPLWGSLKETVIDDYPSTIKRALIAAGLGGMVGHMGSLGAKMAFDRPLPPNFGAAAAALPPKHSSRAPLVAGPAPQSGPGSPLATGAAPSTQEPAPPAPSPKLIESLTSPSPKSSPKLSTPDPRRQAEREWNKVSGQHHIHSQNRDPETGRLLTGKKDPPDDLIDALTKK